MNAYDTYLLKNCVCNPWNLLKCDIASVHQVCLLHYTGAGIVLSNGKLSAQTTVSVSYAYAIKFTRLIKVY